MMSRAASVVFNRLFKRAFSCVSRAISACSADSLPTFSPGFLPTNTPASRCLRHSLINDEYKDTEDLAGLFSGFDHEHGVYDLMEWRPPASES